MTGRFARNSLFSTIAGISASLASFLTSIVLAHTLGVGGFGMVAYILWIVGITVAICDLGGSGSLARYLPELSPNGRSDLSDAITGFVLRRVLMACLACIIAFGLYAGGLHIHNAGGIELGADWRSQPVSWVLIGIVCACDTLCGLTAGYLRGIQRFDVLAGLMAPLVAVRLAAVAIGGAIWGIPGVLAGLLVPSVLFVAIALPRNVKSEKPPKELQRRVIRYASYAWIGSLAVAVVWSRVEVFFLERAQGNEAVGLFSVALTLSNIATQGPLLLTGGLLPYFSENFGRKAHDNIRVAYESGTRILAFFAFPACFGTAAIMPALVPVLYGAAFKDAIPAAEILVIFSGFAVAGTVGSNLIHGLDRSDFIFKTGFAGAVLLALAGLTVIPAFGVMGAVWARGIIQTLLVIVGMRFISKRMGYGAPVNHLMRLAGAALLCAAVARLCVHLAPGVMGLAIAIPAAVVVYGCAVRLLGALPKDDGRRLNSLCERLPHPLKAPTARGVQMLIRS